jgi:hypothetical protein
VARFLEPAELRAADDAVREAAQHGCGKRLVTGRFSMPADLLSAGRQGPASTICSPSLTRPVLNYSSPS